MNRLHAVLQRHEAALLEEWMVELAASRSSGRQRDDLMTPHELRQQCEGVLHELRDVAAGAEDDIGSLSFAGVRDQLAHLSRSRLRQGFTPSEIAMFVLSLKRPLFSRLRAEIGGNADALFEEVWRATLLLDRLALYTTEVFQTAREGVITRQQADMMELSTPVVKLWEGVLALPLIGTLDSARTQVVMEALLEKIVETGADTAIIDITGVPTVDTLVAQHLLKTVAAARLMGADCIISGIRPQIAQTIVHLAIDLSDVTTKSTLADAFATALRRRGARTGSALPAALRPRSDGPSGDTDERGGQRGAP